MKNFGKYVYVSCWTNEGKEMIPMWNLYTRDMHGVRIKLPANPFVKYKYKSGEYDFSEACETCIDYQKIYEDNRGMIASNMPELVPICYTNEEEKIFPRIRVKGTDEDVRRFLAGDSAHTEIKYSLAELGRNKREVWSFQKEWRYLLWFSPMGMREVKKGMMSTLRSKIGALLVKPALKETLKAFDMDQYGGAPLLGLKGLVVKTHGSSKAIEVKNSILQCIAFKEQQINEKIKEQIAQSEEA